MAVAFQKPCRPPQLEHLHGGCPISSQGRARSSAHFLRPGRLESIAVVIQWVVVVLQVFVQVHIHGARSCERARAVYKRV